MSETSEGGRTHRCARPLLQDFRAWLLHRRRIRGGLAAFFAMSYIVVLNPSSSVPVPTLPERTSASHPSRL